ncbi:MAG: ABC transporter ATP-binding protein [Candidatus Omnitrophica bacterium]|nr:ABC transporter ATP-binding protein [Candidatus Omnitrophota bacterium]
MGKLFELKNIHYSYLGKFPALCGIDMNIEKGSKIGILGANGSGKSTLLQLLDGLIFSHQGNIKFLDKDLSERALGEEEFMRFFRSKVGFVFQNPEVQLFCPTVEEDIIFGPLQLGIDKAEIKKRLANLVDLLNISNLLERPPFRLSIGEKRKVAIASTLIMSPDVLILDEPTAGLDPLTSRQIVDIIIQANLEGKTIITATHDLHIVDEIADEIFVFSNEKRIARSGASGEILSDGEFLKKHNLVHIHYHKHKDKIHTHPHEHLEHHVE